MSVKQSMEKNLINSVTGLFIGFCLSFFFYFILYAVQDLPFTFQSFSDLHSKTPLLIIIDGLPIFTGIFFYFIFKSFRNSQKSLIEELLSERHKVEQALNFSSELIHGKIEKGVKENNGSNELLDSLNELRETLIRNKEAEELRARDDRQRNWVSEGLAIFGEMLRVQEEKMEDLAYKLISNLVKYLKANQGGFFLIEEDGKGEKYIQMIACYAYDRKKFADKRTGWGEGLIGTCALEKKTIYLLDVPDQYLTITSGLGKANPGVLVLVPLLVNEEVQGIIEIASFSKFEPYQLEFTEKVADSIAMILSNIKGNLRTANLLKETQAQAEALAHQEEKMRQNMEELKITQEKAARQADTFISFTNSVNHTMIRAEYDRDGYLLYANTKFLKKLGYSGNREVEGRHISIFINEKDRQWFNDIWAGLKQGGMHFEGYMKHITRQGQDLWTMATYTSIRRDDGSVDRILFLAIDTTEHKKQSLDYESQISAINRLSLKAEFSPDGKLLSANDLFNNTLKYPEREMQQMSIFDFLDTRDIETVTEFWEAVITGKPYQGQLKMLSKYMEEKWFRVSLTSVDDMYDEVAKVVFLANEITNEKIMEGESRKQTEQLKQQEEKLRLAGIDLNRKMEEKSKDWQKQKEGMSSEIKLFKDILHKSNGLVLSFDNTGILIFVNKNVEKIWKIKSKDVLGKPALDCFKGIKEFPESISTLLDPAKSKVLEKSLIDITNADGKSEKMVIKMLSSDNNGVIIYTLIIYPIQ